MGHGALNAQLVGAGAQSFHRVGAVYRGADCPLPMKLALHKGAVLLFDLAREFACRERIQRAYGQPRSAFISLPTALNAADLPFAARCAATALARVSP